MSKTPHQWHFQFTPQAREVFNKMRSSHKRSLLNSLRQLVNADDPYSLPFVEMLKSKKFERVRKFRVGYYRVFFDVEEVQIEHQKFIFKGTIIIIDIRDRKDAY